MMHGAQQAAARGANGSTVDGERLSAAQRELRSEFPSVPREQVDMLVEGLWQHYEDARVRDFVPLLVRRQAREELRDIAEVLSVSLKPASEPGSTARPPDWVPLPQESFG